MIKATLTRFRESKFGTEGILVLPGFICFTLELPWYHNKPNISCIPPGKYNVVPFSGIKFKHVYHITDVPGRSYILIHTGNFAGDRTLGLRSNTYGCILVGKKFGYIGNQRAVLLSLYTMHKLIKHTGYKPFELEIISLVR